MLLIVTSFFKYIVSMFDAEGGSTTVIPISLEQK